jgi:hypothetical protein
MKSNRAEYKNPHFKHLVIAHTGEHGLDRRMPINILEITRQFHLSLCPWSRTYADDGGVLVKYVERLDR